MEKGYSHGNSGREPAKSVQHYLKQNKKAKLGNVAFWQSKYSIILNKYCNWVKSTPKYSGLLTAGETTPFSLPRRQLEEYSKVKVL